MARSQPIDRTLAALADPSRRKVIDLLRKEPRRAGDLARSLRVSGPALSRHLRVLRSAGLVDETHRGPDARVRVYRLRPQPFTALARWVEEVQTFWSLELAAFAEYAEKQR